MRTPDALQADSGAAFWKQAELSSYHYIIQLSLPYKEYP
jgi:hypothetical protein